MDSECQLVGWVTEARLECLKLFLSNNKGGVFQRVRKDGMPLLHHAASAGLCDVMEWLVDAAGCDVRGTDMRGGTALLEAAAAGKVDAVAWLLRRGLFIDATDDRGDHIFSLASGFGHLKVRVKRMTRTRQVGFASWPQVPPQIIVLGHNDCHRIQPTGDFMNYVPPLLPPYAPCPTLHCTSTIPCHFRFRDPVCGWPGLCAGSQICVGQAQRREATESCQCSWDNSAAFSCCIRPGGGL